MPKHFAIDPSAIKEVWNYCTEGIILPSTAMDKEEGIELKFEKHTNNSFSSLGTVLSVGKKKCFKNFIMVSVCMYRLKFIRFFSLELSRMPQLSFC